MELITGKIRHPPNEGYIIRRQYWVEACLDETESAKASTAETCAELLGLFEWHTNNNTKNALLGNYIFQAKKKGSRLKDNRDWLPFSVSYLQQLLFYSRGENQIANALKRLAQLGFIKTDCPEEIMNFYSRNVKWYKLNVETLNALADAVTVGETYRAQVEEKSQPAKRTNGVIVNEICLFHQHINRITNYAYSPDRKRYIDTRLRERKNLLGMTMERAFAQCVMVIIANSLDDFYQGRSERNETGRVLNWIEYIFKKPNQFERHLRSADEFGITEEIAMREFEAFMSGETSRYVLKDKKTALKPCNAQGNGIEQVLTSDAAPYRAFARRVGVFFADGKSSDSILETLMLDDDLARGGETLTDSAILKAALYESAKTFGELSDTAKTEIEKFAFEYAEQNFINL